MTLLTFYTLYANEMRLLWAPKESDHVFVAFTSLAFFSFMGEVVLSIAVKVRASHGHSRVGR
jgi:hypothetical protein